MSYLAGKLVVEIREGAPNNAGSDGDVARVKTMRIGRSTYPYVSAQSFRRWLRDTLTAGTDASPVQRTGSGKKQQAYTAGEPHRYADDDLFGFMRAIKNEETQRDSVVSVGTLRSISPRRVAEDFGTMTRGFGADDNPVIHRHEFYTADLAADVLVDVAHVGVFTLGGAGHRRSLTDTQADEARAAGATDLTFREIPALTLPLAERRARLAALLEALAGTHGGAKQAIHYGDRTPALLLLAPVRGGVNPFGRVVTDHDGHTAFRADVLRAELGAWADEITGPVRVGWAPGFLDGERAQAEAALKDLVEDGRVQVDHPRTILRGLAADVRTGACDAWFDDSR